MCRLSDAELNCVRTKMRRISACRQPLMGTSMRRYFPPIGTAGLERVAVRGYRRDPWPPPRMMARVSFIMPWRLSHRRSAVIRQLLQSEQNERFVDKRRDEGGRGDGQDPRPDDAAGDAPPYRRQASHGPDADNGSSDGV